VFEMAASLFIEDESGTYNGQIRHSHNGYFAGDFSQRRPSGSGPSAAYAQGRGAPRSEAWPGTPAPATSAAWFSAAVS
jgi:hypothetical protein